MPNKTIYRLWTRLLAEDSTPILDEQLGEDWRRTNPELYAIGLDFADSAAKAWNRLRTLIKPIFIRKQQNHGIECEPTFAIRGDLIVGFGESSNTASSFTDQHSCLFCQKPKQGQFHLPDSTESPLRIKSYLVTHYVGGHTSHEWGEKFEVLADAVCDCKVLLMMGKHCYIAASGDPEFPYLIVVPAWYSPKPMIH
jgi:hypothetical protein